MFALVGSGRGGRWWCSGAAAGGRKKKSLFNKLGSALTARAEAAARAAGGTKNEGATLSPTIDCLTDSSRRHPLRAPKRWPTAGTKPGDND